MRSGNLTIADCTLTGSSAMLGGGIYSENSSPTVTGCVFDGGGMTNSTSCSPTIINCSFAGNWAGDGGAVRNEISSSATMTNCILRGDWAVTGPEVSNDGTSSSTVTYSNVQGGHLGTGNINADPMFMDAAAGDLSLAPGSPCTDAADGDAAPEFDLLGYPRHDDIGTPDTGAGAITYADMGAHEFRGNSGLVGWWKLDETTGVTAADSSGNNEIGTLAGCTFNTSAAAGKIGGALDFDGIDDYVNVPDSPDLGGSSFTVAC